MDINQLAAYLADHPFQVKGIYRYAKNPGVPYASITDHFPGFVFPIAGKTQFQFNSTPYIFSPGKVIHGGAKMKLEQQRLGETNWEYILILYRIENSKQGKHCFSNQHFEFLTGHSPRLMELLMRLWHVCNLREGISMFQTEMLFREVLNEALLCGINRQTSTKSHALFERICNYIHTYYYQSLTVASIAEQNNINRNRLTYIFTKYTGAGPAEYLMKYRIRTAQQMLLTSNAPIQQISLAIGITDPFYFSRIFKKKIGISPTSYREKFINNPCLCQQTSIQISF